MGPFRPNERQTLKSYFEVARRRSSPTPRQYSPGRGGDPDRAIARAPRMSVDSSPITPRSERRPSTHKTGMMTGGGILTIPSLSREEAGRTGRP